MNKFYIAIIHISFGLFLSGSLYAASEGEARILGVQALQGTEEIIVRIDRNDLNPAGCVDGQGTLWMEESNQHKDELYAMFLAATMANRQVYFWVDQSNCLGTVPKLLGAELINPQ